MSNRYEKENLTRPNLTDKLINYILRKSRSMMSQRVIVRRTARVIKKRILKNNDSRHISLKKLRELYYNEDSSLKFSLETLRTLLRKRLKYIYGNPKINILQAIRHHNNIMRTIFLYKYGTILREGGCVLWFEGSKFYSNHNKTKIWMPIEAQKVISICRKPVRFELLFLCSN